MSNLRLIRVLLVGLLVGLMDVAWGQFFTHKVKDPIDTPYELLVGEIIPGPGRYMINAPGQTRPASITIPDGTAESDQICLWNADPLGSPSADTPLVGKIYSANLGLVINPGVVPKNYAACWHWSVAADGWVFADTGRGPVRLTNSSNGASLSIDSRYLINVTADASFQLPTTPAWATDVLIDPASTGEITFVLADGTQSLRLPDGSTQVGGGWVLPSDVGQVRFVGDTLSNGWVVFITSHQDDTNIPNWQPNTTYAADDQVIAANPGDGVRYYYQRLDTAGPASGAVFDVTEAAEWIQLGAAADNLPVLESFEITFRGHFSSFTVASGLVLIDGTGNDYSMADWTVIGDTVDPVPTNIGKPVAGLSFDPPVNGTRTIKLAYNGAVQKRGLSAFRVTLRNIGTTSVVNYAAHYYSGVTQAEPHPAGVQTDTVTIDVNGVQDWDFITLAETSRVTSPYSLADNDELFINQVAVCTDTHTYSRPAAPVADSIVYLLVPASSGCTVDGVLFENDSTDTEQLFSWRYDADALPTPAYVAIGGSAVGGLPQQGELPAVILTQGIYSANGVNTATTLPAATGSQDRVMIHATTTHGGTVISVQPGESLLRVGDSSYTTQAPGELLLFIDSEVGNWDMNIVGNAISVSSRVGEMFFAPAGSTRLGVLPMTPGTVTGGALAYPVWAAMFPEFISGDDIVFPPDVAGMFLRNLGGNAATEGVFQADRLGSHRHVGGKPVFGAEAAFGTSTGGGGNGGASNWDSSSTARPLTSFTGAVETNPANRSYQLYVIVDNYDVRAMEGLANSLVEQIQGATTATETEFSSAALNQGYINSSNPYKSPQETVTLGAGTALFDIDLYQATTSLENGTRVGGVFRLYNQFDVEIASHVFREHTRDSGIGFFDSGSLSVDVAESGTYKYDFENYGGVGGGNRTTSGGILKVGILNAVPVIPGPAAEGSNANGSWQDVGTWRTQRGTFSGAGVDALVTFPQPFADTSYQCTTAIVDASTSTISASVQSKTTTGFNLRRRFINLGSQGEATENTDWTCIGLL